MALGGPDSYAIGVPKAQEALKKTNPSGDSAFQNASCGCAVGDSRAIRATREQRKTQSLAIAIEGGGPDSYASGVPKAQRR